MDVQSIPVDSVTVSEGRLPADMDWAVPNLVQSISEVGLLHPITVVRHPVDPTYILVAGRNRLEAVRRLGWKDIMANVQDYGSLESEVAEVVENLHRRTLDQAERDRLIARYVELCQHELYPNEPDPPFDCEDAVYPNTPTERKPVTKAQAVAEVADRTGMSEMTVRRAMKRATLSEADRQALEDAGQPLADITAIASVKVKEQRDRLVALCTSGLSFADAQIVLDLPDDEVSGIIAIQATVPLIPTELVDVVSQDPIDRKAIICLIAASMPYTDAMREVLGDRWANDPQAEHNLSDEDWAERYCGELACYRNSERATFVRAVGTYRRVRPARITFERAIDWSRKARTTDDVGDPYRARLVRFLSVRHPSQWTACPGRVNRVCYRGRSAQGTCDRCQGAGFLIG